MIKETKKDIIKELVLEERKETDMIHIYKAIIDVGAANCLPSAKQEQFKKSIETLHEESEEHSKEVLNLLEKYRK